MNTTDIAQSHITSARWFLRIGLAFVYAFAAAETQFAPANFLKYVPAAMQTIIPVNIFLTLFGIFEILLVIWLLSGKYTQYAGIISFLVMISIIVPNMIYFTVLFRNVAIAFASLALFALDSGRQKSTS